MKYSSETRKKHYAAHKQGLSVRLSVRVLFGHALILYHGQYLEQE